MKRITALLLVCLMAVCTASCSKGSGNGNDSVIDATTAPAPSGTMDPAMAGPAQGGASAVLPDEAEQTVRAFAESSITGDVDTMVACMYPSGTVEAIEQYGIKQEFAVAISGNIGGKLTNMSTDNCRKLSAAAMQAARNYFEAFAEGLQVKNRNYQVSDGYCLDLNVELELNGETSTYSDPVSVIMVKGDGWKLIPSSEEDLESMLQSQTQEQTQEQTQSAAQE